MKAWELIADPKRWTQFSCARTAMGDGISPESPDAARWCARGALMRVYNGWPVTQAKIVNVYWARHQSSLPKDNDREGMTAAVMSSRLRIVEEEVLAATKGA